MSSHLVCQERDPFELDWVDAAGDWDGGALGVGAPRRGARDRLSARPRRAAAVYVADRYEGIEARPFAELSEEELDRYLEANVAAVAEIVERARPDVALANHLVMGPADPRARAGRRRSRTP